MKPAAPSAAREPSTKLGDFYRAHRPEVLGGVGVVVAGLAYWRSKHGSSSSSASTSIDPATGYPTGSSEDEAALAAANGAGTVSGGYSGDTGSEGSTGYSGGGYGGDGGDGSNIASALTGIQSTLTSDQTLLQGLQPDPTGGSSGNSTTTSPVVGRTNAQNEALTKANLAKDVAAEKKAPSAKNKAAVKNLTARLGKEKAA